jgi:hypothetical protein
VREKQNQRFLLCTRQEQIIIHMTPHENILIDTKKPNVNNIISASKNLLKVKSAGSTTLYLDKDKKKK